MADVVSLGFFSRSRMLKMSQEMEDGMIGLMDDRSKGADPFEEKLWMWEQEKEE